MTYDQLDDPRGRLWQQLEYEAIQEAKDGDGRALRVITRLRAKIEPLHRIEPVHQDNGE